MKISLAHATHTGGRSCARSLVAALALAVIAACGGGDGGDGAVGTYVHDVEGTIVLEADGTGSLTQSSDPVEFDWDIDGDTVTLSRDGEVGAQATLDGDELTFRPGDFSGDDPETFVRQD